MSEAIEVRERPILFSGPMVRGILEGRKTKTRRVCSPAMQKALTWFGCEEDMDGATRENDAVVQWLDEAHSGPGYYVWCGEYPEEGCERAGTGYGQPGDRLWVREAWADTNGESGPMISYRAGGNRFLIDDSFPVDYSRYPGCQFTMWCGDLRRGEPGHRWRPSIHMPRWASRITLELTNVRVERVQEISREDAIAEGVFGCGSAMDAATYRAFGNGNPRIGPVEYFRELWDSINGPRGYGWDANPWVWVLAFRRVEGDR